MAQNRFYSSTARRTNTTVDPGSAGTTLTVADSTVFSSLDGSWPWTALINWGQGDQEIVNVTARPSSTTLTIVRGQDGTTGQAHAAGVTVDHGVSARDFTEAGAHVGASSGVHGVTGSVVGTSDVQTLSNKQTSDAFTVGGALTVTTDLSVGGIGQVQFKRKTANKSILNNTLANDTDFAYTVAANATYVLNGFLICSNAAATADFQCQWTAPASATLSWAVEGQPTTASAISGTITTNVKSLTDPCQLGTWGTGTNAMTGIVNGVLVISATAGTFQFQWAQVTTDGTNATVLQSGTWMTLTRVA
ncbi:MAG: hypothetical protein JWL97_3545 [Gemmatimonadales bacterium]|nr:hypothetical protein [Gemmatimonadales bacterium]